MNSSDRSNNSGASRTMWAAFHTSLVSTLKVISYIWNKGGTSFRLISCLKAFSIIGNARGHLKLIHVISLPHARALAHRHHRLAYRYLNPYLAKRFCKSVRLEALTNHYEYLQGRVNDNFLIRVYEERPTVWGESIEGHLYSIQLCFPSEHDCEGDMRLDFKRESTVLYTLTFTITPGRLVDAEDRQVLLITAIQGASKKIELIKEATKICNDTSPAHLLLAAAQGVALSLGISAVAGVGTAQQISREDGDESSFVFDYDHFWESFTGEEVKKDFYLVPVPFREKPIELVKANRRSRAIRRRELRGRVTEQVRVYFRQDRSARPTESTESIPCDDDRTKSSDPGAASAVLVALLIESGKDAELHALIDLASVLASPMA